MNRFDYLRPGSVAEAVAAAAEPGSAYLAAGTNLLDLMKGGVTRPDALVDITRLPGLDRIERLADGTEVTLLAEHMEGMEGVKATIASSTDETVYMVDYETDGMKMTNHKWVVESEIQPAP